MPSRRKKLITEAALTHSRLHSAEASPSSPEASSSSSSSSAASSSSSDLPGFQEAPKKYKNKSKVLVFASRGIQSRHRHLMEDLRVLLPHSKRDTKFDQKDDLAVINDIADTFNCNTVIYFEARKHQDLYMYAALASTGPTIKFHVTNIHTTDELRLTGNCLRGSRPLLSFDRAFEEKPHLQLTKEVLTQIFDTPKYHPRSKPFFDHVFSFSIFEGRIWFRHYQIVVQELSGGKEALQMVEIGPRFVLDLIGIQSKGFCGAMLYKNPDFVSPNTIRALVVKKQAERIRQKSADRKELLERKAETVLPRDPLQEVFKASTVPIAAPKHWDDDVDDDNNDDDDDEEVEEESVSTSSSDDEYGSDYEEIHKDVFYQ